ncbi:hypothetical protein [Dyadobacter sp. CY356]|uniref:hypothetical protein n=1 Tax=Dyadobacter sp. CY356 TaxID=2906442 RepID=UPI001F295B06|nr:hypothetical protein [Dyadobacter sp. CY356]MCF0058007.1 hypothetical protein [Dyadobacter sp. CY356]
MSNFFIILIKAIVGFIWFVATVVTTILLSPFMLAAWISRLLNKKQNDNNGNPTEDGENQL